MPAKAGIQNHLKILDSRLRGNDAKGDFKTFYETINIGNLTDRIIRAKGGFQTPKFYTIKYLRYSSRRELFVEQSI
jgi:hypothetical protein